MGPFVPLFWNWWRPPRVLKPRSISSLLEISLLCDTFIHLSGQYGCRTRITHILFEALIWTSLYQSVRQKGALSEWVTAFFKVYKIMYSQTITQVVIHVLSPKRTVRYNVKLVNSLWPRKTFQAILFNHPPPKEGQNGLDDSVQPFMQYSVFITS